MLPDLYARWCQELLGEQPPEESLATCNDCAMCGEENESTGDGLWFNAETKCCTYHPSLPNFLVGMLLADESPEMAEGRARIRETMRNGVRVTPWGLPAPRDHTLRYSAAGGSGFGISRALRCPYYLTESGGCGIWRYRNSVCSTWFCKHVRGSTGHRFWEALKSLLGRVEFILGSWCLSTMKLEPKLVQRILAEQEMTRVSPSDLDGAR